MKIGPVFLVVGVILGVACQVQEPVKQPLPPAASAVVANDQPLQGSSAIVAAPDAIQAPQSGDAGAPDAALRSQPYKSCSAELGNAAAKKLVAQCIQMSPATSPPCNAANPCALILDEIRRGCAMRDATARPSFCSAAVP
jgi:hypothetical protein